MDKTPQQACIDFLLARWGERLASDAGLLHRILLDELRMAVLASDTRAAAQAIAVLEGLLAETAKRRGTWPYSSPDSSS